jgi:hypothetical protein
LPAPPPHRSRRAELPHRALQKASLPQYAIKYSVFAIPRSEVGLIRSGSTCPGKVSFTGYDCLSAPSPHLHSTAGAVCERPYRLRVIWADPTPDGSLASLQLLASAPPTCSWIGGG